MVNSSAARPVARPRRALAAGVAVALALAGSPAHAHAHDPATPGDESVAADAPASDDDAPAPDRRRGALRLGIASLLTGVGVGLIVFGVHEFGRAQDHLAFCRQMPSDTLGFGACRLDPPALGFTSAGLSWGLSLPLVIGAGLLFARGAADLRGERAPADHARATLHPWWRRDGAGLGFALRF